MSGLGRETPVVLRSLEQMVDVVDRRVPFLPSQLLVGAGVLMLAFAAFSMAVAVRRYSIIQGSDLDVFLSLSVMAGMVVLPLLVMRVGLLLARWNAPRRYRWMVAIWGFAGASVIGGTVLVGTVFHTSLESPTEIVHLWVRYLIAGIGLLGGLLVGQFYVIAIAGREQAASQRDAIIYLNKFLRHHVLNNVNVIQGYTGLLSSADRPPEESKGIDAIETSTAHLERLVEDVGRINRVIEEVPALRICSLSRFVEEAVSMAAPALAEVTITTDVDEEAEIMGDDRLVQIFAYLLRNVSAESTADPTIDIAVTEERGEVRVRMVGDGVHIAERNLLLMTDTPDRGDANLELYIVQLLARRYQSDITIHDPSGDTLDVEFVFPAA